MRETTARLLLIKENSENSALDKIDFIDPAVSIENLTSWPRDLKFLNGLKPDVIILENDNALDLIKKVRVRKALDGVSLVIIDNSRDEKKILEAFASGADDYITRPFSPTLLLARVKALVRRRNSLRGPDREILKAGSVRLNTITHEAHLNSKVLPLTLTEFRLLKDLVTHLNSVRSRQDLRADALNNLMINDRTIDVHIGSLRRKLEAFGANVRTVRGMGYRLVV